MNERKTIEKCKKILSMFEELKPRKQPKPSRNSKSKNSHKSFQFSQKKSKDKYPLNSSVLSKKSASGKSQRSSVSKNKSVSQYMNPYNKESRFDKIMKLNVKPAYKTKKNRRESFANRSFSSVSSLGSEKQNQKSQNRLQKIMNLKVKKPQVSSTLVHYRPEKKEKSEVKKRKIQDNEILLMKECKDKIKRIEKQSVKEDRLWKAFERERQLRQRQKKINKEKEHKKERSMEKRFESLVSKELQRIESHNELKERKVGGFSTYIYPSY